eukprot:NODE_1021_length_1704_cov_24.316424_g959_i0.p1 GENE.NODE_1021_length_1704_cov_24.316424_g959_i0~~NODE_1021_length_1704_cov_24.316424_g959_i0.p1  ORF type:complete len:543 (+),score=176.33 NODE_1021_length_1704_cov_24.316424_g959_i0:56-1630(+)
MLSTLLRKSKQQKKRSQKKAQKKAQKKTPPPGMSSKMFADLPLHPKTLKGLAALSMSFLTPVQEACFPMVLKNRDVIVQAPPGTGKTIIYLVPVAEAISKGYTLSRLIPALVLSPSRELALQIKSVAEKLFSAHKFKIHLMVGGLDPAKEKDTLSEFFHMLIATAGRFSDHCWNTPGFLPRFVTLRVLVLDEVDLLIANREKNPTLEVLNRLPNVVERKTLLVSSTIPEKFINSCLKFFRQDKLKTVQKMDHNSGLEHQAVLTTPSTQLLTFLTLLKQYTSRPTYKILVFTPTESHARVLSKMLTALKLPVLEMHSKLSQAHRVASDQQLRRTQKNFIMVSSSITSRGLDYPDLCCVLHFLASPSKEAYIHRSGRTARCGAQGQSILLLLKDFDAHFLKKLKDMNVKLIPEPTPDPEDVKAYAQGLPGMKWFTPQQLTSIYIDWLGYFTRAAGHQYKSVRMANDHFFQFFHQREPAIPDSRAQQLNLGTVQGIKIIGQKNCPQKRGPPERQASGHKRQAKKARH